MLGDIREEMKEERGFQDWWAEQQMVNKWVNGHDFLISSRLEGTNWVMKRAIQLDFFFPSCYNRVSLQNFAINKTYLCFVVCFLFMSKVDASKVLINLKHYTGWWVEHHFIAPSPCVFTCCFKRTVFGVVRSFSPLSTKTSVDIHQDPLTRWGFYI